MSWSVGANGFAKAVAVAVAEQVAKVSMSDAGEMETVKNVGATIAQTLATFADDFPVEVSASGSMAFQNWAEKTGPSQTVSLSIKPIYGFLT